MQQHPSSLSPIGNRITRVPGIAPNQTQQMGGISASSQGLHIVGRENPLNKSQNMAVSSGINANYAPTQLLQSSTRQKKSSLSFLRKSNITAAGSYQNQTPQKTSLNINNKRINMIGASGSNSSQRLSGLNQSKSTPGLVKIRTTTNNGGQATGASSVNEQNTMLKQPVVGQQDSASNMRNTGAKNPAKSLNATINLEQMLQGSRSSRVLP